MTFVELMKLLSENNVPVDVHFMSDSGWECSATEMDGVYYNKGENIIVFTQGYGNYDEYWNAESGRRINLGNFSVV